MTEEPFSRREQEVIDLLLQGKSNKQIATALGVSSRTIEFHLSHIYTKLGVTSRTEAVLKLSKNDLRESTGSPASQGLRDSAVEKTSESADNGNTQIQLRRRSMKTLLRITFVGILLTALIIAFLLIEGAHQEMAAPSEAAYQALGPAAIEKDGMLFEATGSLTCTEFTFNVHATFPAGFADQFPGGEIPSIFSDVSLVSSVDGAPLQLERFGGGGGGGGIGGFETLGQGIAYHVLSPLVEGQEVQITAAVTFSDYVGIPEPVPFELYLFVGSCATPTPQPYQYTRYDTITTPAGATMVVTARLTQSVLTVQVEVSGGMGLVWGDWQARNDSLSVFSNVQIEFPDQTRAFALERFAGGGSGPGEGQTFLITQEAGYRVLSALEVGQIIPVIIWITFDPLAGIPEPVPFSFELKVAP